MSNHDELEKLLEKNRARQLRAGAELASARLEGDMLIVEAVIAKMPREKIARATAKSKQTITRRLAAMGGGGHQ